MLQHIWAIPSPLPILVLSRPNRPQDRVQALDLGADELVTKPFSFNELSARVRALVRRGGRSPKTISASTISDSIASSIPSNARAAWSS